jgi:hypothetical protein
MQTRRGYSPVATGPRAHAGVAGANSHAKAVGVKLRFVSDAATPIVERVNQTISDALQARRVELEELIQTRVDEALDAFVRELVDAQLASRNGDENLSTAVERFSESSKRCSKCQTVKPATAYEANRAVCRSCRREQERERTRRRRQAPAGEAPAAPLGNGDGFLSTGSADGETSSTT